MNILICDPIGESGIEFLKNKGYTLDNRPTITPQELLMTVGNADAIIVRGRTKVTKDVIDEGKKLKIIGRSGSGLDTIDLDAAKKRNISVINAPGANAQSVAEHVFALMLALTRNLFPIVEGLKKGKWKQTGFSAKELFGKTLGVLGNGHIGKRVALLGEAFGMNVLIYKRGDKLEPILSSSDIITIHLPLTDETRGLLSEREFSMMKKTAFIINTARGAIIDEQAFVAALREGRIAAAALDVYSVEPPPTDSPLFRLPNVILTPHVGADSIEAENRASLTVAQEIDRVLQKE